MKVTLQQYCCLIEREPGDPVLYDNRHDEVRFWGHLRNVLKEQGYNVVRQKMWKDGHLVDDDQYYVRTKHYDKRVSAGQEFAVYDTMYAVRFLTKPLREDGQVILAVDRDERTDTP